MTNRFVGLFPVWAIALSVIAYCFPAYFTPWKKAIIPLLCRMMFAMGMSLYRLRWEIETLFDCLKGRGGKLEDTRMIGCLRIKKLLLLPVIGFCWSHKVGDWKHDCVLPIKIKTHQRLAQSIFRYGFDYLRLSLFNGVTHSKKQMKQLILLLCPASQCTTANGISTIG